MIFIKRCRSVTVFVVCLSLVVVSFVRVTKKTDATYFSRETHMQYQNDPRDNDSNPDKKDTDEIQNKLQRCINSLNMMQLLSWDKAKDNALTITRWLRTILPQNQRRSTEQLSACWNTSFKLRLAGSNNIAGYVGATYLNFSISNYFSDRLKIYVYQLVLHSGIIDGVQSEITCIPQVFIAGFAKSGTTALDSAINAHPKVEHGMVKEPRWWAPFFKTPNHHTHFKSETPYFVKYMLHYYQAVHRLAKERNVMLLDSSPSLLKRWSNVAPGEKYEDICLIPAVLSTILPNIKLIVIMRDPVEFLYSNFWYFCSNPVLREHAPLLTREQQLKVPSIFHSLVLRRIEVFEKCRISNSIEICTFEQQFVVEEHSHDFVCGTAPIADAIYYIYIRRWLSVIPRENFIFISSADFLKDQVKITSEIWKFLNLEQPLKEELKSIPQRNNSQTHFNYQHDPELFMLPETRKLLQNFYRPFNKNLSKFLGDDKFDWNYD